ncbi:prenyltransferase [Candidatus Fermentibacteria bacterium]|nr:prenyltransferase [Candidatus Fermentibacteria bacterium]
MIAQLRVFWIAIRPYAFPASIMPALIGAAAAWYTGVPLNVIHLFLASLGVALIHAAGNLVNDAYDYAKGIDRHVIPVSGAVVRGLITARQALKLATYCAIFGAGIGIYFVFLRGVLVAAIGLGGLLLAVCYTAPPLHLKYRGLGDLAILFAFGVGVAAGSWFVQTGRLTWTPVVWGFPQAMLVVGILHANNWRDIGRDGELGARSLAQRLGDRGSFLYYAVLTAGALLLAVLMIAASQVWAITPRMPWTCLLVFLAIPQTTGLIRSAYARPTTGDPPPFVVLDAATAQLNLTFGLLFTAGLVLGRILGL